ncbi:MAG: hypothetical protein HYZ11_01215 [Candidatus Tectomicrobia bacterium]|uniref:Uncharacterized protein n=1 Tax=Tectimicrobiota bacterium TaxID=2528274 RepID=A0A932MM20_UNCTE|nr:hypothetical protein [Candidatus Tectomicrobia bacterium]
MKRILPFAIAGLLLLGWGASRAGAEYGPYYAQPRTGVILYFGYPVYQYAPRYYYRPHVYRPHVPPHRHYYRPHLRHHERTYQHLYPTQPRGPWYRHR